MRHMPYIITTRRPYFSHDSRAWATWESPRTAVTTPDEAREACFKVYDATDGSSADLHESIDTLPESGGTIGPLPDGTVIEVRRVEWRELLAALAPGDYRNLKSVGILDAFNAR